MYSISALALALVTFSTTNFATGQSTPKPSEIAVRLSMDIEHPKDPKEANAVLTITNVGNELVQETSDNAVYHLHVAGPKGEPTKTLWYRKLLAGELLASGGPFIRYVPPGASVDRTFLLSAFYDLTTPGTYTVSVGVRDSSGAWIETNKATFRIDPD